MSAEYKTRMELIEASGLFDARYYFDTNPDLKLHADKINPLEHYLDNGAFEGRDPHPLFASRFYLNQHPDLLRDRINPLMHFVSEPNHALNQPHEMFDVAFYTNQIGGIDGNPVLHFLNSPSFVSPHPIFDPEYYLSQLSPSSRTISNPLLHFLTSDDGKFLSPHPIFDAKRYAERYPDLVESNIHLFLHYLRYGCSEGREANQLIHEKWYMSKYPELKITGENPLLHHVRNNTIPHPFFDPKVYRERYGSNKWTSALADCILHDRTNESFVREPILGSKICFENSVVATDVDFAFDRLLAATDEPFTHLFILPGMYRGGSERATATIIEALHKLYGVSSVVLLLTQYDDHPGIIWLPEGTRCIDVRALGGEQKLSPAEAAVLILALLDHRAPKVVHLYMCLDFLRLLCHQWARIQLKSQFLLYLWGSTIFLENAFYHINGPFIGEALKRVDCAVMDTNLLREAIEKNAPERMDGARMNVTFRALAPKELEHLLSFNHEAPSDNGYILWASRLIRSKRPDLLIEIAKSMPNERFHVFGSADGRQSDEVQEWLDDFHSLSNIFYKGAFSSFAETDYEEARAFLYTSDSDGVPIVLLEAAALGLPIVAPKIGGIPEFISDETGWLVRNPGDVSEYIENLQMIKNEPNEAKKRAREAKHELQRNYSYEALNRTITALPEFF